MNTEGLQEGLAGFGNEVAIVITLVIAIVMIAVMIKDSLKGGK